MDLGECENKLNTKVLLIFQSFMKKTVFDFQKEMRVKQRTKKQMFEISNSNFFSVETKPYKWQCFQRCSLHQSELTASRWNVQTMLRKNTSIAFIIKIVIVVCFQWIFRTPGTEHHTVVNIPEKQKLSDLNSHLINDLLPSWKKQRNL